MLNPVPLLGALRFEPAGSSEVAGRPTVSVRGFPRPRDTRHGWAFTLHDLGAGAELYELEIDRHLGVLLAVTAVRDGQPFYRITTLSISFDDPIPDETFHFEPPAGEEIQSRWGEERVEHVTLVEAQQRAPFTVLTPDTVPANWQVQCRLVRPSERPPSPMQIGLSYRSVDGHESMSLSQFPAGGANPYRQLGDGDDWERVTRDGIEMRTRPSRWGQAQVELERDGKFVHLMSDNLTRDQVLDIAAKLRPAPSHQQHLKPARLRQSTALWATGMGARHHTRSCARTCILATEKPARIARVPFTRVIALVGSERVLSTARPAPSAARRVGPIRCL